jgi:hypothetical protein
MPTIRIEAVSRRALFLILVLTAWFSKDLAWSKFWFPQNFILFIACLLTTLPLQFMQKKWRIGIVAAIFFVSILLDPRFLSVFVQVKLLREHYFYINLILSFVDLFVAANVLIISVESRPKILTIPIALIAGLIVGYMVLTVHYRWT